MCVCVCVCVCEGEGGAGEGELDWKWKRSRECPHYFCSLGIASATGQYVPFKNIYQSNDC